MNKIIQTLVLAIFCILTCVTAGSNGPTSSQNNPIDFSSLTFLQLQEICNPNVIEDFDSFFQGWIINTILVNKNTKPSFLYSFIGTEAKIHTEILKRYLEQFEKKKKFLATYSLLHFQIN